LLLCAIEILLLTYLYFVCVIIIVVIIIIIIIIIIIVKPLSELCVSNLLLVGHGFTVLKIYLFHSQFYEAEV